ncbi:MAG: hypothetical protein WAM78_22255 [Candidatus Sulfotelmatobacter sp.]
MKKLFVFLLLAAFAWGGLSYYRNRSSQTKVQAAEESQFQEAEAQPQPQPQDPIQPPTVVSPLKSFMEKVNPFHKTPVPAPPSPKSSSSDHIAPSPVGTSAAIVRKTFSVISAAKFPFEVPPHAASPQLKGSYRSFVQSPGGESSDENADMDLLLMNDQQYADFLHGGTPDVIYSVDSSHDQDVSFGLPATMNQPAQYYLVFRTSSHRPEKTQVQADFRVDF